jgi:hypothetical protein
MTAFLLGILLVVSAGVLVAPRLRSWTKLVSQNWDVVSINPRQASVVAGGDYGLEILANPANPAVEQVPTLHFPWTRTLTNLAVSLQSMALTAIDGNLGLPRTVFSGYENYFLTSRLQLESSLTDTTLILAEQQD